MSDSSKAGGLVRPMTVQDLSTVLAWRNHPDVRAVMFHQHEIGIEEHRSWFERSCGEEGRHLLVFEQDGQPRGFMNLHIKSAGAIADWGFYVAPAAPKGTGRALGRSSLDHAFHVLNAHKVSGRVLACNQRSIKFHHALGFLEEGVLRDHHFDGHGYHDVVCFGLLRREWRISE